MNLCTYAHHQKFRGDSHKNPPLRRTDPPPWRGDPRPQHASFSLPAALCVPVLGCARMRRSPTGTALPRLSTTVAPSHPLGPSLTFAPSCTPSPAVDPCVGVLISPSSSVRATHTDPRRMTCAALSSLVGLLALWLLADPQGFARMTHHLEQGLRQCRIRTHKQHFRCSNRDDGATMVPTP